MQHQPTVFIGCRHAFGRARAVGVFDGGNVRQRRAGAVIRQRNALQCLQVRRLRRRIRHIGCIGIIEAKGQRQVRLGGIGHFFRVFQVHRGLAELHHHALGDVQFAVFIGDLRLIRAAVVVFAKGGLQPVVE